MVFNLSTKSHHALYLYQVWENISKGFKVIEETSKFHKHHNFRKGQNLVKDVGRATALVLCTLPENILYLYQVS